MLITGCDCNFIFTWAASVAFFSDRVTIRSLTATPSRCQHAKTPKILIYKFYKDKPF